MFSGSLVALITPMDTNRKICFESLKNIVNYHITSGTSALVVASTTGECSSLTSNEQRDLITAAVDFSENRIPVIAGIFTNNTIKGIKIIQDLNKLKISGYLIVTPYFNLPKQDGIYLHFKLISENTTLPQIIYNVPSRTGCDILPETIGLLSEINNIVGIKEASGDLSRIIQIKKIINRKNFYIICGSDAIALNFMKLSGHGVISVTANIAARQMAELCNLIKLGQLSKADYLNNQLMPLHIGLFCETNPIPVKWIANKLNLIKTSVLRLPMTPLHKNSKKFMDNILNRVKILHSK